MKKANRAPPKLVSSELGKSSSEIEQQFEVELYWCINQLQKGLSTGKLSPKQNEYRDVTRINSNMICLLLEVNSDSTNEQTLLLSFNYIFGLVQDHTKALNTLMSKSAPIIKKRQVMRLSFGDYRSLMASEEKKHAKSNEKVKLFSPAPNTKSKFVRKATGSTLSANFKFNFDELSWVDDNESATNNKIEEKCEKLTLENNLNFAPSSNSFKFNFDMDCDS